MRLISTLAVSFIFLLFGPLPAAAQAPSAQWDRAFGGSAEDRLSVVRQTADGGYILGGASQSGVSADKSQPSQGGFDYWVVKLDGTGAKTWDYTYGGTSEDRLTSLQQTADGGYILGGFSSSGASGSKTQPSRGGFDYWVVKLNAQGLKTWDFTFGGGINDRLAGVQQTADGGYILGGQSDSGASGDKSQAGQGSLDYWLVKLDAAGAKVWDRSLGGISNDILNGVQQTTDGGYILGGFSYSGVSGDKSQPTFGSGDYDYWVVKVDATGTKQWDRTLGGTGFDNLTSIQQTADGGYLAAGFSNSGVSGSKTQPSRGDFDNWLVKLSPTGIKQWDRTFGGDGYDSLNGLQQTADRGYVFGSQSNSSISGEKSETNQGPANTPDFWAVKVDSAGTKQWDRTFGGTQDDVLTSLRQTADGGFILGGFSNSGVSGNKTQAGRGNFDFWVVKLNPVRPSATRSSQALPALELYPNPAHTTVTVQLPATAPRTGLTVSLLDATGRLVWQRSATPAADGRLTLPVGSQTAGFYRLKIENYAGYTQTQRLLLE